MARPVHNRILTAAAFAATVLAGAAPPSAVQGPETRCVTFGGDVADLTPEEITAAIRAGNVTIDQVADPFACGPRLGPMRPEPTAPPVAGTPLPDFIEPDEYDVCYLVTDAEMEAIMHRRLLFGASYGVNSGGIHDCNFQFYLDPIEMVSVTLYDDADAEGDGWSHGEPVPGIGDEAYWSSAGKMLWVAQGDQSIAVLVWSETVDPLTAAKEIASLALPRME